jgi:hypothetical protein
MRGSITANGLQISNRFNVAYLLLALVALRGNFKNNFI